MKPTTKTNANANTKMNIANHNIQWTILTEQLKQKKQNVQFVEKKKTENDKTPFYCIV